MGTYIGIMVACMVLVFKTATIMAATSLNSRRLIVINGVMGGLLFTMMVMANDHRETMATWIDTYTFESAMAMSALFIYLGLHDDGEGHSDKGRQMRQRSRQKTWQGIGKRLRHGLHVLPCPFCMLALAVMLAWAFKGEGILFKEGMAATAFSILLTGSAIGIRASVRKLKFNPTDMLNPLLLFSGSLTMVFALFIPNYVNASRMGFKPLTMESNLLVPCLIFGGVLLLIGIGLEHEWAKGILGQARRVNG